MGEEENQREMHLETRDAFNATKRALQKYSTNTEPSSVRAGRDPEDKRIQRPHFIDKAGNKMTCPRSHSWLVKGHLSLL